jgi:putative phosphoribosyl transferase
MSIVMQDRRTAGRDLARALLRYRKQARVLVLALPRGGLPVAAEVARELHAPLDVLIVRKLVAPGHEEVAMGAIAAGGTRVLNGDVMASLGVDDDTIECVAAREQAELDRGLALYRGARALPAIEGRYVIVVDDGAATGATMRAAVAALREQGPARVVIAVPVAPFQTVKRLREEADEVVCLATPEPFGSVGRWYADFPQLWDEEVQRVLAERWIEENGKASPPKALRPAFGNGPRALSAGGAGSAPPARVWSASIVRLHSGDRLIEGRLTVPEAASGLVVFVDGSADAETGRCNDAVADCLAERGYATLVSDLLTAAESRPDPVRDGVRFDVALLAARLREVCAWIGREPELRGLALGFYGSGVGAAAALSVAADRGEKVGAIVAASGRPDLAGEALARVRTPTLLLVGALDERALPLNVEAAVRMAAEHRVDLIPGAGARLEEPGKLAEAAVLAADWFGRHFARHPVAPGLPARRGAGR